MKGVRERLVVELDEVASEHLRRHIQGKTILNAQPGDEPALPRGQRADDGCIRHSTAAPPGFAKQVGHAAIANDRQPADVAAAHQLALEPFTLPAQAGQ